MFHTRYVCLAPRWTWKTWRKYRATPILPKPFKSQKLLKQAMKMNWWEENSYYTPEHDSINPLGRNVQTRILTFRTGHCKLKAHLYQISLFDSATCRCTAPNFRAHPTRLPWFILPCREKKYSPVWVLFKTSCGELVNISGRERERKSSPVECSSRQAVGN